MYQLKLGWIQGQQTKWVFVDIKDLFEKDKSYLLDIRPNHIFMGSHLTDFNGNQIFQGDTLISENDQIYTVHYDILDSGMFYCMTGDYKVYIDSRWIFLNKIIIQR